MPAFPPDRTYASATLTRARDIGEAVHAWERSVVLKAEHRLRKSDDFSSTVRRGVSAGRRVVVVHILPDSVTHAHSNDHAPPRVGFVVGRTIGGAVVRNAVRRRLRHLMNSRISFLPPGAQVVVRARPEAGQMSSAFLAKELDAALESARRKLGATQ